MRAVSLASLLTASFLVMLAPSARANDPAGAQALFDQAKQLVKAGRFAEACPKLEESQRLDPGIGTQFHIADCDEHIGKTATAWAMFLDVAGQAHATGQKARERIARDRAAALEPTLSRMTILGSAADVPGLEVRRDGVLIGKGEWGTPLPVDPGQHEIRASAPGKIAWNTMVRVDVRGRETVTVPRLADAPAPAAAAPQPAAVSEEPVGATHTTAALADVQAPDKSDGGTQRAFALGLGALAVAGAGVGTYFLLASKTSRDDSNAHCVGNTCDATGVSQRDDALRRGNVATIAYTAAGAALIGSAVLFFTAPNGSSSNAASTHRELGVGVSPAGVVVRGAF